MTAFVDTFAFIAWMHADDAAHSVVSEYLESFTGQLVTTEWVLVELADALSHPSARASAVQLIEFLRDEPQYEIVPYDVEVFDAGFDLFAKRPDKEWSLTDCISFAVMTERGLTDALTADHHFAQAGFHAVFKR